jgi:hypothetical protein
LGSQILTRLDQNGNKSITYVPADGLLFATQTVTQNMAGVAWTQRDPVGISETGKGVYDPLGNYLPFQPHDDPRPPVGSYNSSSMAGFYASFASNPFQLNVGCIRDGIPTSCDRVLHDINRGLASQVTISGTQNPNVALANAGFIPQVRSQEVRPNFPDPLDERNAFTFSVDVIDSVAIIPGRERGIVPDPTTPQNRGIPTWDQHGKDEQKIPKQRPDPDCDKKLAGIFADLGEAVAAGSGYEPSNIDPNQYWRPHEWRAMHIYPKTPGALVSLYAPPGGGVPFARNATDVYGDLGSYGIHYDRLGAVSNVTLVLSHVTNFTDPGRIRQRTEIGTTGHASGTYRLVGYHAHLAILDSHGRDISFHDAFCGGKK